MEKTIQLELSKAQEICAFARPSLSLLSRHFFFLFILFGTLSFHKVHANSKVHTIKELKEFSTFNSAAGASAKAPLCQILFQKAHTSLSVFPNELNEKWTINSIGAIGRQIQFPGKVHSDTVWITNQSSNIFSEPKLAVANRLHEIKVDFDQQENTQSSHEVTLVHTLVGANQISGFFHQILQARDSFHLETRGELSIDERSKQSMKSTAVAFFFTFLFAPKAMPLAIMPAQFLYYWNQEKVQLERTFQAIAAIQILLNHPYQNAFGFISLDQYTLSRPNILKQEFLKHDLPLLASSENMKVLHQNIQMNIPGMRMFLDLLSKAQKNEKIGHHQKLMFDFIFESSELEEPKLHLVLRTEKPHLYFEK